MDLLEAIILGVVQGMTEFLPVSSSGHLVLVPWWLGMDSPPLFYVIAVHIATILAVIIHFWKDWIALIHVSFQVLRQRSIDLTNPEVRLLWYLFIGTLPAAIIGYLFADFFENLFATPRVVSFNLLITASLLIYSERIFRRFKAGKIKDNAGNFPTNAQLEMSTSLSSATALFIGFAQAIAIMPGLSRSGSTISAGLFSGLNRVTASRFSFLLSTPIILGAGLKQMLDTVDGQTRIGQDLLVPTIVGFLVAFVVGYLSITWLLALVRRHSLYGFAIYCVAFGLLSLGATFLRG